MKIDILRCRRRRRRQWWSSHWPLRHFISFSSSSTSLFFGRVESLCRHIGDMVCACNRISLHHMFMSLRSLANFSSFAVINFVVFWFHSIDTHTHAVCDTPKRIALPPQQNDKVLIIIMCWPIGRWKFEIVSLRLLWPSVDTLCSTATQQVSDEYENLWTVNGILASVLVCTVFSLFFYWVLLALTYDIT